MIPQIETTTRLTSPAPTQQIEPPGRDATIFIQCLNPISKVQKSAMLDGLEGCYKI